MAKTINDVPMLTSDEHEIKLNGLVYTFDYGRGYSFSSECEFEIQTHRVISVNQSARHFRLRCAQGCEIEISYSKGCDKQRLFGDIKSVKTIIEKKMLEDIAKCRNKTVKVRDTETAIKHQMRFLKRMKMKDLKQPKSV